MKNTEQKNITIAIAEDHAKMRAMISSLLKGFGFKVVIEAPHGKELIEQLSQLELLPDVCLLDINMPVMKGFETACRIRAEYPEIKIAALTANKDIDSLVNMLKNGASSYLVKSSDPSEWKDAISSLVNKGYYCTEWMGMMLLDYIKTLNLNS